MLAAKSNGFLRVVLALVAAVLLSFVISACSGGSSDDAPRSPEEQLSASLEYNGVSLKKQPNWTVNKTGFSCGIDMDETDKVYRDFATDYAYIYTCAYGETKSHEDMVASGLMDGDETLAKEWTTKNGAKVSYYEKKVDGDDGVHIVYFYGHDEGSGLGFAVEVRDFYKKNGKIDDDLLMAFAESVEFDASKCDPKLFHSDSYSEMYESGDTWLYQYGWKREHPYE